MLVANKGTDDKEVIVPHLSRRLDHRLRRHIRRRLRSMRERRVARVCKPGSEIFSTSGTGYMDCSPETSRNDSVVHLHWVARFIDYKSFFAALPRDKALVWTLHDMNPFTGGCHYSDSCERFLTHCGACPQLDSNQEWDISRRTFDVKSKAFADLNFDRVALVAPSAWIAREARRSALFGRFRIERIPLGLDLNVFRPHDRGAIRRSFGIQDTERVILFVCDFLENRRKGLDLLVSAIKEIKAKSNLVLVSVGTGVTPDIDGVRRIHVGRVNCDRILCLLYNIADVFVIPSREDNLPQTPVEALACGCPVVGFLVGGLPDIVKDGETGYLVRKFDVRELRSAIETAIARRDVLLTACRTRSECLFDIAKQAQAYMKLYASLRV
jgi:glycosyltransferase involved in cell wall biosynthesis